MPDTGPVCGAPKDGGYRLHCELPAGHDGWHKAVYRDNREMTYLGSRHIVEMTETVTWEPVDHVREAVSRLMAGHGASPVATKRETGAP